MRRLLGICAVVLLLAASAALGVVILPAAPQPAVPAIPAPASGAELPAASTDGGVRFAAVDVFIDSHEQSLGAYQMEIAVRKGHAAIVGIEGGAAGVFHSAPYYDPAALQKGRIIIAAFSTEANLPKGKTLVARLHMQIEGDATPEYASKLTVATGPEGKDIAALASLSDSVQR